MLTHCLLEAYDSKHNSMFGIVNADATRLIKHYRYFMPTLSQFPDKKFAVNEFISGRSCCAFILNIGTTEEERDLYVMTTLLPC